MEENLRVQAKVKDLIEEMKQSEDYITYQRLQRELEEDEELYKKITEFKRQSFFLHQRYDVDNAIHEVRNLRRMYQKELLIPKVEEYLLVEQKVCKMIRDISEMIADGIHLDYRFLEMND